MDEAVEAMLQARCTVPGTRWDDGLTEGVARIERMLMERALQAAIPIIAEEMARVADEYRDKIGWGVPFAIMNSIRSHAQHLVGKVGD